MRKKDYPLDIQKKINRIQNSCYKKYSISKKIIISERAQAGFIKCEGCKINMPVDSKWDIHAYLHSMDTEKYYAEGNLIAVCKVCHRKIFKIERYDIDGEIISYEK